MSYKDLFAQAEDQNRQLRDALLAALVAFHSIGRPSVEAPKSGPYSTERSAIEQERNIREVLKATA